MDPAHWLSNELDSFSNSIDSVLEIPTKEDGSPYLVKDLYKDQEEIVFLVLNRLKEWLECKNYSLFKPLRMIITGAGGSGKSVVINTIVSAMRRMFGCNDVIKVLAPTGTAAFNVYGETVHHFLKRTPNQAEYTGNSMSNVKKKELIKKCSHLLALICDERSLLDAVLLGTTKQIVQETIFNGFLSQEAWGGLPIFILVGDDYQLPAFTESAFYCMTSTKGGPMARTGRNAFLECTDTVTDLFSIKRMNDNKEKDKQLLHRLRFAEETDEGDVQKLMSLRLSEIRRKHGSKVVEEIEKNAIYLFYKNEKVREHNMKALKRESNKDNPVAVLKSHSKGPRSGKSIAAHFRTKGAPKNPPPPTSYLCRNAKVAIYNRNFCPQWGLHNGACGTVKEIAFNVGENPNHGNLPKYIVVEFPQYCGPVWDNNNPKVSTIRTKKKNCI